MRHVTDIGDTCRQMYLFQFRMIAECFISDHANTIRYGHFGKVPL